MDELMKPGINDRVVKLPITFNYKGGRGANMKFKVIFSLILICVMILGIIVLSFSELLLVFKVGIILLVMYVTLFVLRMFVFNEMHFSDMYEELLEKDFQVGISTVWQIFEISPSYPYICYYKNGYKGLFVRMEMGTVTGKSDTVMYDHYEAISDAYNMAHSLNMNMILTLNMNMMQVRQPLLLVKLVTINSSSVQLH